MVLSRVGWKTGAIVLAALAAILVLAPRINSVSKAEDCQNPPDHAVLNYWPVSFDPQQTGCTDFTTLDGKVVGDTHYSTSQADHDDGVQVADGQEVYLLAYVHNGAASNSDPSVGTARDVELNVNVPTAAGTDHTVTAAWHGSNTNTASGSFTLHTTGSRTVEIVPNSGQLFDAFGNAIGGTVDISSGHYVLGDQQACFEFAKFFRFKVRIANPVGTPALSITKQVRNVTQGSTTYSSSTTAATGQTVQYQIKVKNTGTATALNTTLTDTGTSGTSYTSGTLQISNGATPTSIPGTMTLGNLAVNEEVTITYSSTVTGGPGTYVNTATTQATNIAPISATATVIVSNVVTSNNAECVSVTLNPASPFSANQAFTGTIRVRNSGTTTWVPANGFALGSQNPQDNTRWGTNRVALNGSIAPGQEATFTVNTFAPSVAGTYSFAWQMVQNSTFFGAICSTPVVVPSVNQDTTLSVTKNVRNLSDNSNSRFVKSVNADEGDTVEYQVRIRNTGSVTANNVTLRDSGTSGTSFISGSISVSNGNNNSNNSFPGTISLGNLGVGEDMVVTYRMRVTDDNGRFVNTATADASNTNSDSDTAEVVVDNDVCTNNCGSNNTRRLAITKLVRNLSTGNGYSNTTSASNGDRVQFQITVRSTGNSRVNDVRLNDDLPSGLRLVSGSIEIDGDDVSSNSLSSIDLGDMNDGDRQVVTLIATVDNSGSSCSTRSLQNIARASADNANSVEDDAFVTVGCVQGSNINLSFAKRAHNDTKNVDATTTTASRGDFITYTLTVTNSGNADATNFVITDDLSGVLPFADMVDLGGGSLNGNSISYPALTIPANGSVSKTFRVRIKTSLSQSLTYQLQNTYGNTVVINVGSVLGSSTFIAPVTGAAGNSAMAFAGLLTLGFIAYKKRELLKKLILA
jgi:uncharacterized repeat protein (TIGR01451 family)